MSKQIVLDNYKQQIADLYNRRSDNYDDSQWHQRITHRLVESAQISPGQDVLDVATGTGHVAIEVAQIVGSSGRVVGVDIADRMLDQARRKIAALNLSNLEFQLADAETLDFLDNSFDRILCAHAFPWIVDMEGVLRQWNRFLKPGGLVGVHTPADTAYVADVVLQKVFAKYDVMLAGSSPIGTMEKLQNLLLKAGFTAVDIKTVEDEGKYISLEQAKQKWDGISAPAFVQSSHPLSQLSSEQLNQIKVEFDSELTALATNAGIWNDGTHFFAFGRKPANVATI